MGALDGLRVIEAGLLVQGPQAAATLAEWGADVIKVELPGFGDQARWVVLQPGDFRSAYFIACNRGKRSVTLDLRVADGREAFLRLAEGADVLITNFTPGTMDAWGLGYEEVAARNPRIVYATGSTYGHAGPDSQRSGADLSGQAAGGLISSIGMDNEDRTPVGATIADHIASQNIVSGVLAALVARERTGRGQRVDTSLVGGQIWAQASEYTGYLLTGSTATSSWRGHSMIPGLYAIFPTSDGWIAIVGAIGSARTRLFEILGRPELSEQFSQPLYWETEKSELFPMLDKLFSTRSTAEWSELLTAADIRFAPVRTLAEVVDDPTVRSCGYVTTVEDASGDVTVVAAPVRFSDTPGQPAAVAPELGQHTEEVLVEAGYTWDDIARLRDAGAI